MLNRKPNLCWREVEWQRPYELEIVHQVLTHLATTSPRGAVIWEVRGNKDGVRFLIGADQNYINKIESVFTAHGNVQFSDTAERKPVTNARLLKVSRAILSLNTDTTLSTIRAGLASITSVPSGAEIVLQIVIGASYSPSPLSTNLQDPYASWFDVVTGGVETASKDGYNSVKEKVSRHSFGATIRIGTSGNILTAYIGSLVAALRTLESAGVKLSAAHEKPELINIAHVPWHFPLRLSCKELASFLLLPVGENKLPGVMGVHPRVILPPSWYRSPYYPNLDRTFAVSNNTKLSISPSDALEHTIILGPTGTGKSTTMLNLIMADINAGRSVLVIDPKSDLVNDILSRIPEDRDDDVVVIDPSEPAPVGFNPFAFTGYNNPSLVADSILSVFKEVFKENWGIRSQDVLSAALLTLAQCKGASLLWLPTILTDEVFRQKITSGIKDKIGLEPFWANFEGLKDSRRHEEIAPVLNKIRQFLLRPGLRNVLGQSNPKFTLTDLFYKRKIVLVPLNKGIIGSESAQLLGSLIVGMTWTLALSRANIPQEKRHMVSVFIDELQDYIALPTDLSDALAQARGLGVSLTMAHQYRAQLPPDIRAGIDTNARNKIVFGLNSSDAKDMANMGSELSAEDFMMLQRYHVYSSFQSGGRSVGWISGKTLPPPPVTRLPSDLRARSMSTYGKPIEETENEYMSLIARPEAAETEFRDLGRRKKDDEPNDTSRD